jgi:transposase
MKRPHASDDVRERALAAVDAGHSVADVAAFFQNDPSTIYRWLRHRAQTGSARARPRSGRTRLIGPEHDDVLRAQVLAAPDATLAMHCQRWAADHGVMVGLSTMHRAIRRLGLTLKKRPSSRVSRMPTRAPRGGRRWRVVTRAASSSSMRPAPRRP